MRYLAYKWIAILCLFLVAIVFAGYLPVFADETSQKDFSLTSTVAKTKQPIKKNSPTTSALPPAKTSTPKILPTTTKLNRTTVTPTLTPTVTLTPTSSVCAPPTPEPLWVDPVVSPTNQLSQIITVYVGHGVEVTVITESGTFTVTGNFNAYTNPALVEISLLPNAVHHLHVTARVRAEGNGCVYAYTLGTTLDRQGAPLEIVQGVP